MALRDTLSKPRQAWEAVVHSLPGPTGDKLRLQYWTPRLGHVGKGVRISEGAFFQNPQHVRLTDHCWIDRNVTILAGPPGSNRIVHSKPIEGVAVPIGQVTIGEATHIAPNCVLSGIGGMSIGRNCGVASNSSLYTFSHHYRNLEDRADPGQYSFTPRARPDQQAMLASPIVVEDYCAIGLNSVLLPGTHLKRGTWLASGSVAKGVWGPQVVVSGSAELRGRPLSDLVIKE